MKSDNENPASAPTSDREMVLTRTFDAPRDVVWKAWTDPNHVAQWWGPRGFTTTVHAMDVRPGGFWKYVMHGPDGTDYDNYVSYLEVVRPERLVYNHGSFENDPAQFHVTVTFAEQGGKTRLTMRSVLPTVEQFEQVKKFGAIELGNQTLDRLGEHLPKLL